MALIVIYDCIRPEAKETLHFFENAHVDIRILSGIILSRLPELPNWQG